MTPSHHNDTGAEAAHFHPDDAGKQKDHAALLDLIELARHDDTVTAVADGNWFDPATWSGGRVPGPDADVIIPHGVSVHYAGESDVRLMTVAVEGALHFEPDVSSRMIVDQLLTAPGSLLTMGTPEAPVARGVSIDVVIRDDVPSMLERNADGSDPTQMGHGIVTHGVVRIEGADKADHLKVASGPEAGDRVLYFDTRPQGWKKGDTLLVTASEMGVVDNGDWITQDELVTIKRVKKSDDGWAVTLRKPLAFDHSAPDGYVDTLAVSVANLTRNITFSSENKGFGASDIPLRGHAMFMHNPDVEVRNAAFEGFGRTDKSIEVSDANQIGRYGLHIHRSGAENDAAVLEGNVVWGSPGWGIVHHDSNVDVVDNVVLDARGAGMVAETGNETGTWIGNLVANTSGTGSINPRGGNGRDAENGDGGHEGVAYFFKSRFTDSRDNVASTAESTGYVFRADGKKNETGYTANYAADNGYDPFAGRLDLPGHRDANAVPTRHFTDNEVYASRQGFFSTADKFPKDVDPTNLVENFLAWEVATGIRGQYQIDYSFKGGLLLGAGVPSSANKSDGFFTEAGFDGLRVVDMTIANFYDGIGGRNITPKYELLAGVTYENNLRDRPDQMTAQIVEDAADLVDFSAFDLTLDVGASDLSTADNWAIRLVGTKTDSTDSSLIEITPRTRHWDIDYVAERGYMTKRDGTPVVVLEFAAGDSVTGSVGVLPVVITLDPDRIPEGAHNHGRIARGLEDGIGDIAVVDLRGLGTSGNLIAPGDALSMAAADRLTDLVADFDPVDTRRTDTSEGGRLAGSAERDMLIGSAQEDRLVGQGGRDLLVGGGGNDLLTGKQGKDALIGGAGNDMLIGGGGADLFVFFAEKGQDVIRGFRGEAGDRIDLGATALAGDWQAIQAAATDGADGVTLALGARSSVTLAGLSAADLSEEWFL